MNDKVQQQKGQKHSKTRVKRALSSAINDELDKIFHKKKVKAA